MEVDLPFTRPGERRTGAGKSLLMALTDAGHRKAGYRSVHFCWVTSQPKASGCYSGGIGGCGPLTTATAFDCELIGWAIAHPVLFGNSEELRHGIIPITTPMRHRLAPSIRLGAGNGCLDRGFTRCESTGVMFR